MYEVCGTHACLHGLHRDDARAPTQSALRRGTRRRQRLAHRAISACDWYLVLVLVIGIWY
jgi:hypothetical protein